MSLGSSNAKLSLWFGCLISLHGIILRASLLVSVAELSNGFSLNRMVVSPKRIHSTRTISTSSSSSALRESFSSSESAGEEGNHRRHQHTEYLATCIPGLAPFLEEELISLGAASTQVLSNAAVSFTSELRRTSSEEESSNNKANYPIHLKALLWVRTAHRILEKMDTLYDLETRDDVYDAVQNSRMPVKELLGDGQGGLLSLSVKVIANGRLPRDISHSHYTALTIKNALVDLVRTVKDGERPNVDLDDPDVPLVAILHSQGNAAEMTLYRSLAPPGSLHKRGYRSGGAIHKAAMKESLAAGLLLASGWMDACRELRADSEGGDVTNDNSNRAGLTLVDPMCGSGSLVLEAAMMAVDFAPGLMRIICGVPGHQTPPVLRWRGNQDDLAPLWKEMLLDASQRAKSGLTWIQQQQDKDEASIKILANDIHGGSSELLEASLAKAGGLNRLVEMHQNDCQDWTILLDRSEQQDDKQQQNQVWVVTNPPWGVRLSDDDHESWECLRTFLRSNCPPGRTQAWVLSGNKAATKHLGLRRSQSVAIKTGQQDLRWIQYLILDKKRTEGASNIESSEPNQELKRALSPRSTDNRGSSASRASNGRAPGKNRAPASRAPTRKRAPARTNPAPIDDDSWY